ncbi:MAG TPA: GNAT family N-acetyltransferase [Thermoanaerobaculia bacterium]
MSTFRPALPSDVNVLAALVQAFHAEDGYPFDEAEVRVNLARLLGDPLLGRAWIAEEDGKAVAYLILGLGFSLEFRGRDAFVDEIYVSPSHRGRGFGTRALALAEEACREMGVRALHLEVERENVEAQALYRRIGYKDHDRYLLTKWIE